ncbi:hypothetical protein EG329_002922 [Mollisiaceae sp. DMI_Dod_QoI]|nr:hypothetical protein EG329_002922 [Helotiales sp. DMI_Dod_QoI]
MLTPTLTSTPSYTCTPCLTLFSPQSLTALSTGKTLTHHPTYTSLQSCISSSSSPCPLCTHLHQTFQSLLLTPNPDPYAEFLTRLETDDSIFDIEDLYDDPPLPLQENSEGEGVIGEGSEKEREERGEVLCKADLGLRRYVEEWRGWGEVEFWCVVDVEGKEKGKEKRRVGCKVQFFVLPESKLAIEGIISGRPVAAKASSEACFQLAKQWRERCFSKHVDSCPPPREVPLPTRVIDVGPSDGSQEPYLKETNGEIGTYVALSHCWGKVSNFVTERQNLEERKREIRIQELPRTFGDAVEVVRRLGYRYLWIDSLCIIQRDYEDWIKESVCMREYYKNSEITISADSASGDHEGFLEHQRQGEKDSVLTLENGEQIGFRAPLGCPVFRNRDTCVSQRAWTLQEFILSPRSLLYTSGQLVWECETRKYCESSDNSQLEGVGYHRATKRLFSTASEAVRVKLGGSVYTPRKRWYNLVDDYFVRDITVSSDGLPAISGLAREIQRMAPSPYAAGIWLDDLQRSLLWTTDGVGKVLDSYRAPSWSWAALGCLEEARSVLIYDRMSGLPEQDIKEGRATLISHHLDLVDDDQFGRVSSGSITIRGKLLPSRKWRGAGQPYFQTLATAKRSHISKNSYEKEKDLLICSFDVDVGDDLEARVRDTFLLQISTWAEKGGVCSYALLLVLVDKNAPQCYRRVGVAEVPHVNGLEDEGWEVKDVCII